MIILWVVVNHEDDDHDEDGKDGDGVGVGVGDIILPEHLVPPLYCSPDHSWQRGQRDDHCRNDHHDHHHYGDDHDPDYWTDDSADDNNSVCHFENYISEIYSFNPTHRPWSCGF